ncbi:MAG: histidine triad nucleotide-binding protein [Chloroflexota bacterium]
MAPEKKDCIFCQIVAGQLPAKLLYEDDEVVVFPDINPAAPTHLLVVTRRHIPSVAQLADDDTATVGHMVMVANRLARQYGFADSGYRLVINCGKEGGQMVPHLHLHLLAGRKLSDAMG